jgi:hypothetical protein
MGKTLSWVSVIVLLIGFAVSLSFRNEPTVQGKWVLEEPVSGSQIESSLSSKMQIKLKIENNRITNHVTCLHKNLPPVTSEVSAKVIISDRFIEVRESAKHKEVVGKVYCLAELKPTKYHYFMKDDTLTITDFAGSEVTRAVWHRM